VKIAAFLNSIDFPSGFGIPGLGKNWYYNTIPGFAPVIASY
jgi:hypothetical protein